MAHKILEILLYLTEEFRRGESVQKVKSSLMRSGYSSEDVELALSFFLYASEAHPDVSAEESPREPKGVRCLHESERLNLSPEAYGYLLKLRELNLISTLQLERIMSEFFLSTDPVIEIEEVKRVVAGLLLAESPLEDIPEEPEDPDRPH